MQTTEGAGPGGASPDVRIRDLMAQARRAVGHHWQVSLQVEDSLTGALVEMGGDDLTRAVGQLGHFPRIDAPDLLTTRTFVSGDTGVYATLDDQGDLVRWLSDRLGIRSVVVVPLKLERTFGLLTAFTRDREGAPAERVARRLERFADEAAPALYRARARLEDAKFQRRLSTLRRQEVAAAFARSCRVLLTDAGTVISYGIDDDGRLELAARLSADPRSPDPPHPTSTEWMLEALRTGRAIPSPEGAGPAVALPMMRADEAVGLTIVQLDRVPDEGEDLEPLVALGRHYAAALVSERGRRYQLSSFLYLNELIASSGYDVDSMVRQVTEEMIGHMSADAGVVCLVDRATGQLVVKAGVGYPEDALPARLPIHSSEQDYGSIAEYVVRTGRPYAASNTADTPYYRTVSDTIRSEVAAPLRAHGEAFGVALCSSRTAERYSDGDIDRLQFFADHVAAAMDNSHLLETVRQRGDRFLRQEQQHRFFGTKAVQNPTVEYHFGNLVGSPEGAMGPLYERLARVCSAAVAYDTVLIHGETGCGKEMVAFAIHNNSPRRERAMVTTNIGALGGDSNLIQSELFGHDKGAFTGATHRRDGCFERADGSTLFLDEVGDVVPSVQVKLLRVLHGGKVKEFTRLGGAETVRSDVRVIAATNKDLREELRRGRFREDLYYRLSTLVVRVPPLRERRGDIPLLATAYLTRLAHERGWELPQIRPGAFGVLREYDWPGNVRQLEGVLLRSLVLFGAADTVTGSDVECALEDETLDATGPSARSSAPDLYRTLREAPPGESPFWELVYEPYKQRQLDRDTVRSLIERALADGDGYYKRAARRLGVGDDDYMRFMDFLKNHRLKVDYRPFRR